MRTTKRARRRIPVLLILPVAVAIAVACSKTAAEKADKLTAAEVLGPVPIPAGNPQSAEKIELGELLFFDPRLSASNNQSCASCHDPDKGFSDGLPRNVGAKGELGRNSPSTWNVAFEDFPAWDGSMASIEQHSGRALTADVAMAQNVPELMNELNAVPEYKDRFRAVFGSEPSLTNVLRALGSFQRSVISWRSADDRFNAGDKKALSAEAQAGKKLFNGMAGCATCHTAPLFTDNAFHALGVPQAGPRVEDPGRFNVTGDERDRNAFRTPTLRNVALTAPYMHDGVLATLADVIAFYDAGGGPLPNRSPLIQPLGLSAKERKALVAYLESLTHEGVKVKPPKLP